LLQWQTAVHLAHHLAAAEAAKKRRLVMQPEISNGQLMTTGFRTYGKGLLICSSPSNLSTY